MREPSFRGCIGQATGRKSLLAVDLDLARDCVPASWRRLFDAPLAVAYRSTARGGQADATPHFACHAARAPTRPGIVGHMAEVAPAKPHCGAPFGDDLH